MQKIARAVARGQAVTADAGFAAASGAAQNVRMATSRGGVPHLEGMADNSAMVTDGRVKIEVFSAGTIGSS